MLHDHHAWEKYPQHRSWFNKLEFSLRMGYNCGPCGVAPTVSANYIVRPIYNLIGMGIGAKKKWIDANDCKQVPPGYFWCEWFEGEHISTTYKWNNNKWEPVSSWQGFNNPENLTRFSHWKKVDQHQEVDGLEELSDVETINIEYIGGKPIEIHLRPSPDPEGSELIVPIWADQKLHPETEIVYDYEDCDGYLEVPRIGFYVR